MKIVFYGDVSELMEGILFLADSGIFQYEEGYDSFYVEVSACESGLSICGMNHHIKLQYKRKTDFFRAVGFIIQKINECELYYTISEKSYIKNIGFMMDCSRNAVATVTTVKSLIRHMALMGLNTLQLYTEDIYELPEYPYFGYLRGRYSDDELREMDKYASVFGIEMIPCIQTLAHLTSALRWPCFDNMRDLPDILLCDEEETYRLIEASIRQMASCFKSKTINIGMDEAYMLGLGKYFEKNGYTDRAQIMLRHLNKVVDICNQYGFSPMMWSDMFFHLAGGGEFGASMPEETAKQIIEKIPPNIRLVFWEYENMNPQYYSFMLREHTKICKNIAFAGGAWKWGGFAPHLKASLDAARAALPACLENHIDTVFVTTWGNNGAECSTFTILPVLQIYAEFAYRGKLLTDDVLSSRLKACTNLSLEEYLILETPNHTTETQSVYANPSKYLLYQDVPVGLFDRHVDTNTFPDMFNAHAEKIGVAGMNSGQWKYLFDSLENLCKVLSKKCVIGHQIRNAYEKKDHIALQSIVDTEIPELLCLIDEFVISYRKQWFQENKPQGFEVFDIRIGGVMCRLENMKYRIQEYLSGNIDQLEELQDELLFFDSRSDENKDINAECIQWHRIATASVIALGI